MAESNLGTEGKKLEFYLRRRRMPQKELAEALEVEPSYVSRMVKDHIGWVNGKYFGRIAAILRLSESEIKDLNPAAVVERAMEEAHRPQRLFLPSPAPELQEMIETYSVIDEELKERAWRQFLAGLPTTAGASARDWYDVFTSLKRIGLQPDKAC